LNLNEDCISEIARGLNFKSSEMPGRQPRNKEILAEISRLRSTSARVWQYISRVYGDLGDDAKAKEGRLRALHGLTITTITASIVLHMITSAAVAVILGTILHSIGLSIVGGVICLILGYHPATAVTGWFW
jgi:hypothetical protein